METLATGAWLTRERIIRIAALYGLASILTIAWLFFTANGVVDYQGRALGADFSNVWAAGKMALDGRAVEVWQPAKFAAVQRSLPGGGAPGVYIWVYPPPFLLVATMLAMLPYLIALITWQLATLASFGAMMRRLTGRRETLLLTLAAPATLICVTHGQNGFLTALLLGGGLTLLDRRPVIAGLLFGCLIYKPQFAILLPVVFLAGRHWRAIAGAAASATILSATAIAIWGWPVWPAFFTSTVAAQHLVLEQGGATWYKLTSPFAAVRMWHGSLLAAYAAQGVATAAAIGAVAWVWAGRCSAHARNALVCAAALISTPYVFDYDFVILLPAIAFLVLDAERSGWLRWEKSVLALTWMGPLAARQAAQFASFPLGLLIVLSLFIIALRRALRHRHPAVHMKSLPCDVPGLAAGEVDAGGTDVIAATHRTHRNSRENGRALLIVERIRHRRRHKAGSDRVHRDVPAGEFLRD
jgi:hypothetical protein